MKYKQLRLGTINNLFIFLRKPLITKYCVFVYSELLCCSFEVSQTTYINLISSSSIVV